MRIREQHHDGRWSVLVHVLTVSRALCRSCVVVWPYRDRGRRCVWRVLALASLRLSMATRQHNTTQKYRNQKTNEITKQTTTQTDFCALVLRSPSNVNAESARGQQRPIGLTKKLTGLHNTTENNKP